MFKIFNSAITIEAKSIIPSVWSTNVHLGADMVGTRVGSPQ